MERKNAGDGPHANPRDAPYVIVVDVSTRKIHAYLVSRSGMVDYTSSRSFRTVFFSPEQPYIVNIEPGMLWEGICGCVADCVKRATPEKIKAVTATCQRFTTAIVDRNGGTPALCPNMDVRGAEMEDVYTPTMGVRAYQITGLHPSFLFSADRIRWYAANDPKVFDSMKCALTMQGWMFFKFTGVLADEPTQLAGTFLFDIRRREWCPETCQIAGISEDQLPKIVQFGELVGHPTSEFQKLTGLGGRTPVVMGAGDTQCAGIGSAAFSPGQAFISLGSTAPLQAVMTEPKVDGMMRMWTSCFPMDGMWVLESNASICGTAFDWLASSVLRMNDGDRVDYEGFDRLARSAPPGSADVAAFIGPNIMDAKAFTEVKPAAFVLPSLLVGEKPGAGEFARACYECIAFACRGNLEQMAEVTKIEGEGTYVSRGLSRSALLRQILADVLNKPISFPEVDRASAIGCAVAAWSYVESENPKRVAKELVRLERVAPTKDYEAYEAGYRRWKLISGKLGDLI